MKYLVLFAASLVLAHSTAWAKPRAKAASKNDADLNEMCEAVEATMAITKDKDFGKLLETRRERMTQIGVKMYGLGKDFLAGLDKTDAGLIKSLKKGWDVKDVLERRLQEKVKPHNERIYSVEGERYKITIAQAFEFGAISPENSEDSDVIARQTAEYDAQLKKSTPFPFKIMSGMNILPPNSRFSPDNRITFSQPDDLSGYSLVVIHDGYVVTSPLHADATDDPALLKSIHKFIDSKSYKNETAYLKHRLPKECSKYAEISGRRHEEKRLAEKAELEKKAIQKAKEAPDAPKPVEEAPAEVPIAF